MLDTLASMVLPTPGGPSRATVNERQQWWVAYGAQTAVNAGSELLIFVPRPAHSRDPRATGSGGLNPHVNPVL
jgi:hypothetical protein